MARIALTPAEKDKRKFERRARKKAERAANKLNAQSNSKKIKGATRKTTGTIPVNVIEISMKDISAVKKMAERVEAGRARNLGYAMGNLMYEVIK